MKRMTFTLLTIMLLGPLSIHLNAQHKGIAQQSKIYNSENYTPCGTTAYSDWLSSRNPKLLNSQNFEQWLQPRIALKKQQKTSQTQSAVITLPVVVHIIHNGDQIGTGENIADEQVLSQIQVLNEDFRKMLGTPGYNDNPLGADIEIEFCLAQSDPAGNATNGIDRVAIDKVSWNMTAIEQDLKPATLWDPERYLNIWVCNFGGDLYGVGGYAFFPEASELDGLEGAESTAQNDGVVMYYRGFGSSDIYPQGNYIAGHDKGRSATHEVGHFLGLRHIWGDEDSCSASDYCDDTPSVVGLHMECTASDTCPESEGVDMIENHMDYTPDSCKNIFTVGQKERMRTVLENSPRRLALSTSDACSPPVMGNDDILKTGLLLYPNPAKNQITLVFEPGVQGSYGMYNATGQLIQSNLLSNATTLINISDLPSGIYFLRINMQGRNATLNFIKE